MKHALLHITRLPLLLLLLLSFTACQMQHDFYACPPTGDIPVDVVIEWDSVPASELSLPNDMTVHWYSASGSLLSSDMGVYGGKEWLDASVYKVMCMDFNGNSNLGFRTNGTRESFEVYNIRMTGTYNDLVPPLPTGEVTVAEAYPFQFYIDSRPQVIDLEEATDTTTTVVEFHPKNALREFTFLVYDVIGAKSIDRNGGAISGMSASYFPESGKLANVPSTILFSRVEAIKDGQTSPRWTEADKALFAAKDPNWDNPDTLIGWTRDWVVGKFATFGPLDRSAHRFRLTVEAITKANNNFHGSWGYWHGEWESTVAAQIDGAMGENGTLEEQLAWRQRNGGYDIILFNDHRLVIPEGEGSSGEGADGGFTVGISDWGEIIDIPTGGSTPAQFSGHRTETRAPVHTYATVPDFVVNGIHVDGTDWSLLFDEQYVYKPESGLIWDYYPKKLWPQGGTVDFYAYAPAGIRNLVTGLNGNGNDTTPPVIEYTMPYLKREEPPLGTGEPEPPHIIDEGQEDLLVAMRRCDSPPVNAAPVALNFGHAFSRVTARAKKAATMASDQRIKVVRLELRNLDSNGKYNFTTWTDLSAPAHYRFHLVEPAVPIDDGYTSLVATNDGVFVMPQVVGADATVYIEYDVYTVTPTHGERYETSVAKQIPLTAGTSFEIGKQYRLQMELGLP